MFRGQSKLVVGKGESATTYTLQFDPNAFCIAEETLAPLTTDDILEVIRSGKVGFRIVRALVHAGLQESHPCHLVRAGEIIAEAGAAAAKMAMLEGIAAAFRGASGGDAEGEATAPGV